MDQQELCQACNQKHNCEEVYKRLGDIEGPSVVLEAIVAFVLPVVVFAASLAVFDRVLAQAISATELQIMLSCLLALLVTVGQVLAIKLIK